MLRTIVFSLLPDQPPIPSVARRIAAESAVSYVKASLQGAPFHLRILEMIARPIVFSVLFPFTRSLQPGDPPSASTIGGLEFLTSMSGASANLIRLYRSLATFAFYEHSEVALYLEGEPAHDRQVRFRQIRTSLLDKDR